MPQIDSLDFAEYVDDNRKKLIEHCQKNNIDVDKNSSLSQVVALNGQINNEAEYVCTWYDVDGEIVKQVNVKNGTTVTHPEPANYDPEYLEFMKWIGAYETLTVNHNRNFGAQYRVKEQININGTLVRPTIFKIYLPDGSSLLSPTLQLFKPDTTDLYIDWGDGTVDKFQTSGTIKQTHTYETSGKYIIKIYSTQIYRNDGTETFGSDYRNILISAYMGDNFQLSTYAFYYQENLTVFVTSTSNELLYSSSVSTLFADVKNLKTLIISDANTEFKLNGSMLQNAQTVKAVIFPYTLKEMTKAPISQVEGVVGIEFPECYTELRNYFSNDYSLQWIYLPPTCTIINKEFTVDSCYSLKKLDLSNIKNQNGEIYLENCLTRLYSIETVKLPSVDYVVNDSNSFIGSSYSLKELEIPTIPRLVNVSTMSFSGYLIKLTLPKNWNISINLIAARTLSNSSIIDIAKKLAIVSETKTIAFRTDIKYLLETTYIDDVDNVSTTKTDNNISLLDYIQNKNWTVSFVNY